MEFSKEVIEVFDYLGEKLGVAIDWTSANAMPYLQELGDRYINWEIATSTVWIILGLIILLACIPIWKKFKAALIVHEKHWINDSYIGWIIGFCCCIITALPMILTQIFDIIRCIYLPELQIYQYILTLIE